MYCSFIDFKRAFDSVYRNGLRYKIITNGVSGKLFQIIRSIYADVKSCGRNMNILSDCFSSDVDLMQGAVISPFLFFYFCYSSTNKVIGITHSVKRFQNYIDATMTWYQNLIRDSNLFAS